MTGYKYDRTVAGQVREIPKKFKFTMDIVEHDYENSEYWVELRVYDTEVLAMNDEKWLAALDYLHKVRNVVQLFGIKCVLGGVAGDPPQKSQKKGNHADSSLSIL
jgi:hypothetical protein